MEPVFFLGLSILLVAVSLTAVLVVLIPAVQELARAARSAEKLFDTLRRELPPTLEAIRLTGMEISDLTDDVSESVKNAGQVVKRVDQGLDGARKQAQRVQTTTRGVVAGMKAAWRSLTRGTGGTMTSRRSGGRISSNSRAALETRSYGLSSEEEVNLETPDSSYDWEVDEVAPENHLPETYSVETPLECREVDGEQARERYITSEEDKD
ncbi:MAG: DUF948 domain-containing protein [Leptolyngbyaceae cyanobacterium bins.59]|nr:DUF948 domain-containing protein [Leptolyngbyaceae cyanobacterium bins.59]